MLFKNKKLKQDMTVSYERPSDVSKTLRYFFHLLTEDKTTVTLVTIANIVSTIIFALVPLVTANMVDSIIQVMANPQITDKLTSIHTLIRTPIIFILLFTVIAFGLNHYQEYQMANIGESVSLSLRKKLTDKMNTLPLSYYD